VYIYVVENLINNKRYVGQTSNLDKRRELHLKGFSRCPALNSAVQKYGEKNFDFVIIERCASQDELNAKEAYWIERLKTLAPAGYNLRKGGECGGKLLPETKDKISRSRKGKYTGSEHHQYGTPLTDEVKQMISLANKGRLRGENNPCFGKFGVDHPRYGKQHTEEHKARISQKMLGDNNPSFGRKGEQAFRAGKKHSEQSKKKMSEALRKAWAEGRFKNRKSHKGEV
jgi:group I intron endonuclease